MKARWSFLFLPASLWYAFLFFAPMILFLVNSLRPATGLGQVGDTWTLANYVRFVSDSFYWNVFGLTLRLSAEATLWALILAFPVAYYIVRSTSPWIRWLIPILLMSSFITVVIRALGWIMILGSDGPVNRLLIAAGLIEEPLRITSSYWGVLISFVHYFLPLMALVLMGVLQTVARELEEAAENLGASRWRVFRRIIVPLALPGVAAGSLMVFSIAMAIFTSTVMLGGGFVLTLPVLIYQEALQKVNYPFASTMSVMLMVTVLGLSVSANAVVLRKLRRGLRSI